MSRNTIEQLFGPHLRGPLTTTVSGGLYRTTHPHAGWTAVPSGSATVTVSTALVSSASMIHVTTKVSSVDPTMIQSGGFLAVNSVVHGTSFALAWASGTAVAQTVTGMWLIVNPKQP